MTNSNKAAEISNGAGTSKGKMLGQSAAACLYASFNLPNFSVPRKLSVDMNYGLCQYVIKEADRVIPEHFATYKAAASFYLRFR